MELYEPRREKTGSLPMPKKKRLCFRYTDSTISLLLKSEISSFYPASLAVQVDFCQIWSKTPKTDYLTTQLISQAYGHDRPIVILSLFETANIEFAL